MVHPYLRRRQGKEDIDYPSDKVRGVLSRTMGVPIFQEQVMQIAVVAAGFTPGDADQLRRSMAAWKRKGGVDKYRVKLVGGLLAHGLSLIHIYNMEYKNHTEAARILDSITKLAPEDAGRVVIAASHGGDYAAYCAARGRVRAVVLNDAGVGWQRAGIAGLDALQQWGVAAATADYRSCRCLLYTSRCV